MFKFKKLAAMVLAVAIVSTMSTSVFANENDGNTPVLFAEIADGQGGEYFLNKPAEDMECLGPKSFAITDTGDIYILDTLNNEIKIYSQTGEVVTSFALPDNVGQFIDMEVTDSLIYALNEFGRVYSFNTMQKGYAWKAGIDDTATNNIGLFIDGKDVILKKWDGADENLTANRRSNTSVSKNSNGNSIELKNDETQINVKYVAQPIGTYIAKANTEATYVIEQEALLGAYPYAETRIGKYVDDVKIETALPISTGEYNYSLPYKKIYLTSSGKVYQMVPDQNSLKIYTIPWSLGEKTRITDEMLALNVSSSEFSSDNTSSRALASKETALERANDLAYHGWWYNGTTNRTKTTGTTQSPKQLGTTAFQTGGIPYCWGGMNGFDTTSLVGNYAYSRNFDDAIAQGQTAGNVNTTLVGHTASTAGLDCSGLVCAAYEIPKKIGTSGMSTYFSNTTWENSEPGDIANRSGTHVFMIQHKYTSGGDFYMMGTFESTTDGSFQGAKSNTRYLSDVVNSYKPMMIK